MKIINRDELIALYAAYVQLLEKYIPTNNEFPHTHGRHISPTDLTDMANFKINIAAKAELIKVSNDTEDDTLSEVKAKELVADAVILALAKLNKEAEAEVVELAKEAATDRRNLRKEAKEEKVELAKAAKKASDKLIDAAKIAARKV